MKVSTSDKYNDAFMGMALYLVETDKDGVVSLQGIDKKVNDQTTLRPAKFSSSTMLTLPSTPSPTS